MRKGGQGGGYSLACDIITQIPPVVNARRVVSFVHVTRLVALLRSRLHHFLSWGKWESVKKKETHTHTHSFPPPPSAETHGPRSSLLMKECLTKQAN